MVNFEHVIDVVLVFVLLTLNIFTPFSSVSNANFEQVIVSWLLFLFVTELFYYIRFEWLL